MGFAGNNVNLEGHFMSHSNHVELTDVYLGRGYRIR